jgi:hypothetical protein
MEEIDMDMTAVWSACDEGRKKIDDEKEMEEKSRKRFEEDLEKAKMELIAMVPEILRPYTKVIDIDTTYEMGGLRAEQGWMDVDIPGFALITIYAVNEEHKKTLSYSVHSASKDLLVEDFERNAIYRYIDDYHIALARAYEVMENYQQREHGSIPAVLAATPSEPQYVPLEEELAHSNSEFYSPLVAFLSKYTMNELINLIDSQIDLRLSQIKN